MARRRNKSKTGTDIGAQISDLSLDELYTLNKSLPLYIDSKLQENLSSTNLDDILKANSFVEKQKKSQDQLKAIFFDPNTASTGTMYKSGSGAVSFPTLQKMGDIFIVRSVINTRIEQVQNFLKFSTDEQKDGFTIRKKRSLFSDNKEELTDDDKKKIEEIINFLENGGKNEKWDNPDTFQDFVRKILKDSLTLDQLAFEITRDRSFDLHKFRAIDASMIRFLESTDPRFKNQFDQYRYMGYLPRYGMVWNDQIVRNPISHELIMFYPWELGFGIRNAGTNIARNGYGTSELETLIEVLTWILWGMQYNGNFFKQGSQPKGFINIKGSNIDNSTLNEFRQAWSQTMKGVANSHKTPILQGMDLEWIDLQHTNRDMEFNEWVKFLFVITCSVFRIDPSELGFQLEGASSIFGRDGQRERLEHSRQKGLVPLLIFLQNTLNKYIISELDPDFELVFTGLDVEDEAAQVELDSKKISAGMVSFEDMFEKYSGRKYEEGKDTILNQIMFQYEQAKQVGGDAMNQAVDEQEDPGIFDENPEDVANDNPILGKALEYINSTWGKKR